MQALVVPTASAHRLTDLEWQERPMPTIEPNEVLIKTQSVGLNPVDYKVFTGPHPDWTYPHTLGLDVAGIIEAVGADVHNFRPGQRVCGHGNLSEDGCFAEYVSFPADALADIPTTVNFETAAGSLCAGLTAYQALYRKANLNNVQTVLIHAGAGGVGSMAIQLAKQAGKTVYTTVSKGKQAFVAKLKPDAQIDYHAENVTAKIQALTAGQGVDLIINTVGNAEADFPRLAYNGQLVCVLNPPAFPAKQAITISNLDLGGAHRSGNPTQIADLGQMAFELLAKIAKDQVNPLISQVLTREQLATGLAQIQAHQVTGKLVVNFD
ncbi:zinc-binding dehydrogenase [Lactiplantibacillus xiangfangensis]|uniref:Oxidoreductase n=1 Tax=Lactiplantibacillus xiangfangensis TaxID=942150 RepID=A0A0R2MEA8_9LACO|nr:zinc-binding dehydrogenase [Lactiplantibacillus xiangfangensis]KRO10796.1 oxidoreductase [Lactiplantibacillus xiangfangensis]